MRKITRQAAEAFRDGRKFSQGNTTVTGYTVDGTQCARMYLHGNEIAFKFGKEILLTLAGWPTVTTRERLNGLLETLGIPQGFFQRKHEQYFGLHSADPAKEAVVAEDWIKVTL